MEHNIISEFIGIDIPELKQTAEANFEKSLVIAEAIVKLTEYPEFKVLEQELERMKKAIDKPCEAYATNPNSAHYDSGMKRAVTVIQNFLNSQIKILETYGKNKTEQGKN